MQAIAAAAAAAAACAGVYAEPKLHRTLQATACTSKWRQPLTNKITTIMAASQDDSDSVMPRKVADIADMHELGKLSV
jgi:hypothetical protein